MCGLYTNILINKISSSGLYLIIQNNRYNCHGILNLIEKKELSGCDDSDESTEQTIHQFNTCDLETDKTLKRPLSGPKRGEISKRLCDGKMAVKWRRKNISENSSNRCLYSLDVIHEFGILVLVAVNNLQIKRSIRIDFSIDINMNTSRLSVENTNDIRWPMGHNILYMKSRPPENVPVARWATLLLAAPERID
ncbi:Uncharacterized protein FWK35_00029964 [Aphis craccivora]|uniref:Uncharacterized protein n=1 Tax=Aphis craccivora TaxID=307492 RepID=A0A6G0VTX8_APHCR|nr:Uncharacterized protein FWK35_00029964 [Aphis craccivora]